MPTFTTRFDDPVVRSLDQLAAEHGLSRNAFLEHLARQAVKRGFVPIQPGEGLRGVAPSGGVVLLMQEAELVAGGHRDLAKEEVVVFHGARAFAENDQWYQAKRVLLAAGFAVTHVTR